MGNCTRRLAFKDGVIQTLFNFLFIFVKLRMQLFSTLRSPTKNLSL
jgi:hypothetical protein